jgi:hypothetical protein
VGHHTRASGIVFNQPLRAPWSVFQWRRGPLPEALTSEKCYRARIVTCTKLNSPSRADLLLCRAVGHSAFPVVGLQNGNPGLEDGAERLNGKDVARHAMVPVACRSCGIPRCSGYLPAKHRCNH